MYGYLARRESDMGAFLERFSNQERDSILETWIQNVEIADYDERVDALVEDLPNEAREGMDAIEALDRALVALYDRLAQQVTAPTVQRFFRRLKEVTHRRAREHAETLQQVEDL